MKPRRDRVEVEPEKYIGFVFQSLYIAQSTNR